MTLLIAFMGNKRSLGLNSEREQLHAQIQTGLKKFQVDLAGANGMFESLGFVEWKQPSQTVS